MDKNISSEKTLVTGATGFTGSVLVRKLVEKGFSVRVLIRSGASWKVPRGLPLEQVEGDISDEATVNQAVEGISYIFHLASAYRETGLPLEIYDHVDLGGTQKIACAAARQTSLKRFIHVSTCGVHGSIDEPPADENYRLKPGDIYQRKKMEAELWIQDFSKTHPLPLTIIRPVGIYGPGDRRLLKLFRLALGPMFPLLGNARPLYHLIHVDDLVEFMIVAAKNPRAQGEIFLCGNPSFIPLTKLVNMIRKTIGRPTRFVCIPKNPVFFLADLCEWICKPFGIKPPISRRRINFFTMDRAFNTKKMTELTGFLPYYSYEEGLKQTLNWYIQQGWLKKK